MKKLVVIAAILTVQLYSVAGEASERSLKLGRMSGKEMSEDGSAVICEFQKRKLLKATITSSEGRQQSEVSRSAR